MAHNAKYGVKFVGYSAHVIRKGREVEYAALDFVTGRASVGNLPTLSTELQQRFCRRSDPSFRETDSTRGSEMVRMSSGRNERTSPSPAWAGWKITDFIDFTDGPNPGSVGNIDGTTTTLSPSHC
jgi:hypothetical protein